MKNFRYLWCIAFAVLLTAPLLNAQKNKTYILERTNSQNLQQLAVELKEKAERDRAEAISWALNSGWDTTNLIRLDEAGHPVYYHTTNNFAAQMTNTNIVRTVFQVKGENMVIGEWDGGAPRTTHNDLIGRVTVADGSGLNSHATHVAGTLIGDPTGADQSRGMAPEATLVAYDFLGDIDEMTTEANGGMLVSNHSYGEISGWVYDGANDCVFGGNLWTWYGEPSEYVSNGDDHGYGQYSGAAETIDNICKNAPMYLPVFAAGNDYNSNPDEGVTCADDVRNGVTGTYVDYDLSLHPPGDGDQTSCIPTYANAKNILTVGNLQDDETINSSSSRGKTDDGRIKPDICGNGTTLYSADSLADNSYSIKSGTSMASPNVAGSLLLLQQLFEEKNGGTGQYMYSATLKALAIHTAEDKGLIGPDFTYGWGLLDAMAAATIINEDALNVNTDNTSRIEEREFTTSMSSDSYFFNGGTNPIKITLAYTDLPGTGSDNHNETTPELIHDLDIKLYNVETGALEANPFSAGTELFPTYGDNDVDNVEQIILSSPSADVSYEIRVTVEGSLQENQKYSLIISGIDYTCESDITHSDPINSKIYRASNDITSTVTANNNQIIIYQAGNKVKLNPGFKANYGTTFKADMNGCN